MNNQLIFIGLIVTQIFLSSCEKSISYPLYVQGGGVVDAEDNEYKTVIIGDQEWMAENLKTDLYCNGDSIPYAGDDVRVKVYDNDPENEAVFGKLYNFQAVLDTAGLCPCGWHIPSELEYAVLIDYLGGYLNAMRSMKSSGHLDVGNGLWTRREPTVTYMGINSSGFNALPAGYGYYSAFRYKDSLATFWAMPINGTEAIEFELGILTDDVSKQKYTHAQAKEVLYNSIRCIKDL
jgi:uncharacterized protein (TIGR02145 family)